MSKVNSLKFSLIHRRYVGRHKLLHFATILYLAGRFSPRSAAKDRNEINPLHRSSMNLLDVWRKVCLVDFYNMKEDLKEFLVRFAGLGPEQRQWSQNLWSLVKANVSFFYWGMKLSIEGVEYNFDQTCLLRMLAHHNLHTSVCIRNQ